MINICNEKMLTLNMLTQSQLIERISKALGKIKVLELTRILREEQYVLHDLIDLTFYADRDIAFRAAWLFENVFLQDPEAYLNDLAYLIKRFTEVKYPSCQRHYAKIIMHVT
ncbi:MAG: hypothetical protein JWQ79_443, partial [Mucilaginibacter sp.]|nr:hypothetical protein [Mucilaginibacter sp.]